MFFSFYFLYFSYLSTKIFFKVFHCFVVLKGYTYFPSALKRLWTLNICNIGYIKSVELDVFCWGCGEWVGARGAVKNEIDRIRSWGFCFL